MRIFETATLDPSQLSADDNHLVYNGLDAAVTLDCFKAMHPQLDNLSLATYNLSKSLQAPVLEMMLRGVRVDQLRRNSVLKDMRIKLRQLETQLDRIVHEGIGVDLNWRSPLQLGKLLYDIMNLPVQKKRNSNGQYTRTTDRDALEKLSFYFIAEPVINHILALRDLGKSISFLETGIDPDGRMRCNFSVAGTDTGRWSSSVSDFGTGTNLQNVTESLRSVFIADPGMKFCNLDLEQADSRNIGALCWETFVNNPDWGPKLAGSYLDICESEDLHTAVTKMTMPNLPWGTAPDREVAETVFYRHFDYRYMSKKLGHGSNYLGTPPTLAKQSKLPLKNVKEFQQIYFEKFPVIPALHQHVFHELEHFSSLTTLFGRRRFFFGRPKEGETRRKAIAHMGQSMTADEINLGVLNLWRANRVQLLIQVHDSILFQYPEELEDEIVPWALQALRTPITLARGREFCVPTEAKVGWNWGNYSDENVDGLKKWKGGDDRKRQPERKLSIQSLL